MKYSLETTPHSTCAEINGRVDGLYTVVMGEDSAITHEHMNQRRSLILIGGAMPRLPELMKKHKIVSLTGLFALLLIVVCAMRFPAINVQYTAVFKGPVAAEKPISFVFDHNESYPESSKQSAFPINGAASIRLDSLNQNSQSLVIGAPRQDGVSLDHMEADIVVGNHKLYRAYTVSGNSFIHKKAARTNQFSLDSENLKNLYASLAFKSEIKVSLIAFIAVIYLVLLVRFSVAKKLDMRMFIVGLVVFILIGAFLLNVWLVKKPITYYRSADLSEVSSISLGEGDVIQQTITADQDNLQSIKIPLSISPSISRDDSDNKDFYKVYDSRDKYRNTYVVVIANTQNGEKLFWGLLTPSMVTSSDGVNSVMEIPVSEARSKGKKYKITIQKLDSSVSSVSFMQGATTSEPPMSVASQQKTSNTSDSSRLVLSIGYRGFPYRGIMSCIVIGMLVLVLGNIYATRWRGALKASIVCIGNYLLILLYACFQFVIYIRYIGGFPDEEAHLSYAAFLKQTGDILPDFSRMQIYASPSPNSLNLAHPDEFNRLGHPPLFYLIEAYVGNVSIHGSIADFNINRLRLLSFLIGLAGIAIAFYIGYTRIPKIPILHLLFALMIISPPNVLYSISGVSNDSLALFSMSVFILGAVRFIEQRYNGLTYFTIACGISLTLLSKLTAGLMVVCASVGLLLYAVIKEHKGRDVLQHPAFWMSAPVYCIPGGYFVWLLAKFHTLQPSFQKLDFAGYVHSNYYVDINHRRSMGVWEYAVYYLKSFLGTWQSLAGATPVPKPDYPLYTLDRIAVMAIMIIPIVLVIMRRSRLRDYGLLAYGSIVIVMLYQAYSAFKGFHDNGYPGAYSSRYYDCAVTIFALIIIGMICSVFFGTAHDDPHMRHGSADENASALSLGGIAVSALFALLLVFDGFVFSVLYYADGLTGFIGS